MRGPYTDSHTHTQRSKEIDRRGREGVGGLSQLTCKGEVPRHVATRRDAQVHAAAPPPLPLAEQTPCPAFSPYSVCDCPLDLRIIALRAQTHTRTHALTEWRPRNKKKSATTQMERCRRQRRAKGGRPWLLELSRLRPPPPPTTGGRTEGATFARSVKRAHPHPLRPPSRALSTHARAHACALCRRRPPPPVPSTISENTAKGEGIKTEHRNLRAITNTISPHATHVQGAKRPCKSAPPRYS